MVGGGNTNVYDVLTGLPGEEFYKKEKKESEWSVKSLNEKTWADVASESEDEFYYPTKGQSDKESVKEDEEEEPAPAELVPMKLGPAPPVPAKTQLSKKELKKKELDELDAVLAELGLDTNYSKNETEGIKGKEGEKNDDISAPGESKKSKKKKAKKEKSFKEPQDQPENSDTNTSQPTYEDLQAVSANVSAGPEDIKERLKKVALAKKTKSRKKYDTGVEMAAKEVEVRNTRLAAVKKKDKKH